MKRLLFTILLSLFIKPVFAIETYLIKNNNSNELYVGLLGLGMDYNQMLPFVKNENVLFLYDYSNLDFEFDFTNYTDIKLFAYSAGVMISSKLYDKIPKPTKAIAINGVFSLFDENKGITKEVLQAIDSINEKNYIEFRRNYLVNSDDELQKFNQSPPMRSEDSFYEELNSLVFESIFEDKPYPFDKIFISKHDKMIPYKNQLKAWKKSKIPYQIIEANHFPFFHFESIKDWFN